MVRWEGFQVLDDVDRELSVGVKPDKTSDDDWLEMDHMALNVLRLSLSRPVALAFAGEKTNVGLITKLKEMHEKPSASNQVFLIQKLFNLC